MPDDRSTLPHAPLTWNSLPPAVLNCDSLSLSLLSNQDLKLICFLLLSANYSTYLFRQRLCSRLTALWRYINFVLLLYIIIIIIIINIIIIILALRVDLQLVVLVSAFVMVSTVWSVSCLLFYSRDPPCPMESAPLSVNRLRTFTAVRPRYFSLSFSLEQHANK